MNSLRFRPATTARIAAATCLASLGLASTGAFAAAPVDDIVVTAARISQPVGEVIGSTTVITRSDIQRRQVQSVQDLLRGETGIDIANTGGLGKLNSLLVRGADADQVLVLVNGVRVGSATAGTTRIEYIPVDQIERIEIVRGPRSSLYGADAIGGVVQIFTTRANGPSVAMTGGSHDTRNASASFGADSGTAWFSVAGSYLESQGFNSCRASSEGGCFTDEPDADGFRNTSGTLRAGYRWDDFADVEASLLYASGMTEYDGDFSNETRFDQSVASIRARLSPMSDWDLVLLAGNSRDDGDEFKDGVFAGRFDTDRRTASLQSDWSFAPDQVLSLGVDYVDDRIDSTTPYDETARDNTGVFSQYKARFGRHELLASARRDDNEQFGSHNTGNLGWKWFVSERFALKAAWGNAFLAPNFNDLYFPGFSNPDLKPEQSDSYEIGVSGTASAVRWSLTAFETRNDDLIAFNAATFLPQNISEARIRGIEAEVRTAWNDWSLALGYTGLDPRNRAPGTNYDNILPRRARQSGRLDIGYSFGAMQLGTIVTAQGSRYDDLANTAQLPGYTVVDFIGEFSFGSGWSVQGKIANAFDRDYETARFYYQDGRTYSVTMRYQPGKR